MRFWDSSAVVSLFVVEPRSEVVRELARQDEELVAWWSSQVECCSAFARLRRDGLIGTKEEDRLRQLLGRLSDSWTEIEPSRDVRATAEQLLLAHHLRAADSLQLAAALIWTGKNPSGNHFVCLDQRLRTAARNAGFAVLPADNDS
jgi:predicted nucleic acid-binding protein